MFDVEAGGRKGEEAEVARWHNTVPWRHLATPPNNAPRDLSLAQAPHPNKVASNSSPSFRPSSTLVPSYPFPHPNVMTLKVLFRKIPATAIPYT